MTTDPGDLVLDPTCGSGTTAHVAEQWGRRWITIDTSRVALALARARIMGARHPYYLLADSPEGQRREAEVARTAPSSRPTHGDLRAGFVYERVPHVTLKSIANNAEIDVIWDRLQPAVEAARAALNEALRGQPDPFPVETGGRAGASIDFRAEGEVTLPSGEPAPAGGFTEWEVPREPGTPWPEGPARLARRGPDPALRPHPRQASARRGGAGRAEPRPRGVLGRGRPARAPRGALARGGRGRARRVLGGPHREAARDRRLHRRQGGARIPLRQALRGQEAGSASPAPSRWRACRPTAPPPWTSTAR